MKATWKGVIEMGLLTIPAVKMFSAIESQEKIRFNQLHKACRHRLNQKMFCPECNQDIIDKTAEIIKGYEVSKGEFITLTEGEIETCKKENTEKIKIIQFVDDSEIPPIYFESSSFLSADKAGFDTFSLFYQLLVSLKKTALAKTVIRAKDHFLALRPYNGVLIAYDLHFPSEIRETTEIEIPKTNGFDNDTVELAKQLVLKMTKPFDPSSIKDEYTEGLKEIIEAKLSGKVVQIEDKKEEKKSLSLQEALRTSLLAA